MKQTAIVLVNYKTPWHLDKCLESVFQHTKGFHIFLVQNAPDEESIRVGEKYKALYPELISVKTHDNNLGLVGGKNSVFEDAVKLDRICFLNSDVVVTENWLVELHKALDENPNAVQSSPDSNQFYNEYFLLRFVRWKIMSYFPNFGTKIYNLIFRFKPLKAADSQRGFVASERFYEFCTGACNLVDSKYFKERGYFDDPNIIHGYGDDFDLSYYLKQFGEIGTTNRSYVYHFVNASFNKLDPKKDFAKRRLQFLNRMYVIDKWADRIENDLQKLSEEELSEYMNISDVAFMFQYFAIKQIRPEIIKKVRDGEAKVVGKELGIIV